MTPADRARTPGRFTIVPARTADDLAAIEALFRAYAASLDIDLAYQGFEAELAALPGRYAPPGGTLPLARLADGAPAGCVALRPLAAPGCCEMKRLYVAPPARGLGLGEALARAVLREAGRIGHAEIRLDTLPSMAAARSLHERLGFQAMAPYHGTPVAGTIFLRRPLDAPERTPG